MNIDFNNKTFIATHNSAGGAANGDTIFHYRQSGNVVTADYSGGAIHCGTIVALLKGAELDMRYQCVTSGGELKAGMAIGLIHQAVDGKMALSLRWQWLDGDKEQGTSEYIQQ